MIINIFNHQDTKEIDKKKLKNVVEYVLKKEIGDGNYELNILITDDEGIIVYNKYRKKDEPTDVLSFSYGIDQETIGDIVVSVESIERQAPFFNNNFEEEFFYIIIHGILHIIGYDHENSEEEAKRMFDTQDRYFEQTIKKGRR